MASFTLRQRKRNCAMTLSARVPLKNGQHVDVTVGSSLRNENTIVAVLAVEPFRVRTVRKKHHIFPRCVLHQYIEIQDPYLCFRAYIRARLDIAVSQRRHPIDLIAFLGARQCRKGFGRLLQQSDGRVGRIVNAIFRKRLPFWSGRLVNLRLWLGLRLDRSRAGHRFNVFRAASCKEECQKDPRVCKCPPTDLERQ